MEIRQDKEVFKPIHITLETEEEADYFWHLLNCGTVFEKYDRPEASKLKNKLSGSLWAQFDAIHSVLKGGRK